MPPVNNLPPFREGASFPPPDDAGIWAAAPGSLKQLGRSLKVDDDLPASSQATIIRAIPDPWAQARTFADAVLDEEHSMHDAAIPQWRGLLALFALADLRRSDYSIDIQSVELGDSHPLDRILKHLAPQIAIGGNVDHWLKPRIVYIHPTRGPARPIAMLNPASLVSPGRTSWQQPFDFIPWMRIGLGDPLALTGDQALANTQLAALEAYLVNLRDHLPTGTTDARGGAVRQAVEDYLDAVAKRKGIAAMTASVRRSPDPDLPELYQALVLPAELEEPEQPENVAESKVRLKDAASLEPLKGLILVDEGIATSLGRDARDIRVWGNHTLSELLQSPHALQSVRQEAAERGYFLVTADDLFTTRMVRLRKEPRIPGHSPAMKDMLEPVRPLVLLLDQAATRGLEVIASGQRSAVTLHLRLENGAAIALSRTFRTESGADASLIDEVDWDFGQTSIWPDFRSDHWPYYFARLSYPTTREQIRPQFALSAGIIAAAVSSTGTPQQAIQALQAINDNQAPAEKEAYFLRFQNVAGKAYEELQTSDRPFEAIFYVDYHPDRGEAAAGCARLKLADVRNSGTAVAVAVDFGSTNSVACFGDSGTTPITLKSRIVHPITFQNPARQGEWELNLRWSYVDFLPLKDRPTPTPTVVIKRVDADRNAALWLQRNLIYFQPAAYAEGGAKAEVEAMESYLKRSTFDLKWSEDPAHIDAATDFLEQLMTMIAAEAAAKEYDPRLIQWHFSVPDAMQGINRLDSFRAALKNSQERLSPDGALHDLYSEGLAAARYILSGREGSKFTQGSINAILDIGGSTTDITLWGTDEKRPLWKGSFRLAGRAFFTNAIVQNPNILREIELGEWADLIDPDKPARIPPGIAADVGELLFSRPDLGASFDKHWQRRLNVRPGEALRGTALVYLSGIAYFLGLVARRLVADKIIREVDLVRPAFALCGRGAGIFQRMHGSSSAEQASRVTAALATFSRAAAIPSMPRPQMFISPQPKIEVVAGMMVDFENLDARVGNGHPLSDFTPTGMAVEFADGKVVDAGESIATPKDVGAALGSDLAGLTDFLAALEEVTGMRVDLRRNAGQGAFNEISTDVRQRVERQRGEDGRLVLKEPPFVTALRALVTILASPEKERVERLAVEFGA